MSLIREEQAQFRAGFLAMESAGVPWDENMFRPAAPTFLWAAGET
jgi:hypothetical protein